MTRRSSGEEGMALLVVMVLMGVMLTAGFAIASTVDTQTRESRVERVRDSSFNLAESALTAQIFLLSSDWPGVGSRVLPYPTQCTQATTAPRCPTNASLVIGGSPDLAAATWRTSVHDNTGTSEKFYSESSTKSLLGKDLNGDGAVWVRAQAVAEGRARTLVALVRSEKQEENLPRAALLTGSLSIKNNSTHETIRRGNGLVEMRCDRLFNPAFDCLGHGVGGRFKNNNDVDIALDTEIPGPRPRGEYDADIDATEKRALDPDARKRLKATAQANGTYFTRCPTGNEFIGQVVYVDVAAACSLPNGSINSPSAPGVLILDRASISATGSTSYYGVVYAATAVGSSARVVSLSGSARVIGGVLIDGNGQMYIGGNGRDPHVEFDINAFRAVASNGSAGIIQNTFREIRANKG